MNINENLMVVAMEECSEIQKELSKSLRFGLFNYNPSTPTITNEMNLLEEYYQLQAVIEYMQDIGLLNRYTDSEISETKRKKISKVLKYIELSARIGTIN